MSVSATITGQGSIYGAGIISCTSGLFISGAAPPSTSNFPNEPAGMTVVINTGPLTMSAPGYNQSVSFGNAQIPSQIANISPQTVNGTGEWAGNLTNALSGSGWLLNYPTNLSGGYSSIRIYASSPGNPNGYFNYTGSGYCYMNMQITYAPNWTNGTGSAGTKICEWHTNYQGGSGANENHIVPGGKIDLNDGIATAECDQFPAVFLQGPNGQSRYLINLSGSGPDQYMDVVYANQQLAGSGSRGTQHTLEVYTIPESAPGNGDGYFATWVDGVLGAHEYNCKILDPTNTMLGWVAWLFDPTYGGAQPPNNPLLASVQAKQVYQNSGSVPQIYFKVDKLYMSMK